MTREVVVVSAVRTAIGTFGGSLKDVPPTQLGATVVRESLARAQLGGRNVLQATAKGANGGAHGTDYDDVTGHGFLL